jgi:hypothetical protein|tara:strand:- start:7584 stop:8000 length:417 start_codon:yes stop_codon:yes gene_type:complete
MAKVVKVEKVTACREDKKGNTVFRAAGTLDGRKFVALTIQYKGEPIFKVQEGDGHQVMANSQFTRGDRIAVARACKAARLEQFGSGAKEKVEPDLAPGQTVEVAATVAADADSTPQDELEAAADLLAKIRKLDEVAAA